MFKGAIYPFRGLAHLARHRELWKYAAGAFAVNVVLFTALAALIWVYRGDLADALTPDRFPGWLQTVAGCLLTIVAAVALLFLFTIIGNIVAGPFLDAMTERMLVRLGEPLPQPRGIASALGRSIVNQTLKLLFFGGFQAVSLLLLLTPMGFLYPFVAGFLAVLFLGFEYIDYPLDARRVPVPRRFAYVFRHIGPALGFGGVCFLILFVPLLGYFTLPIAVCGATLMVHDQEPLE